MKVESVHQNCIMGRCANLHIHILLHLTFYNEKKLGHNFIIKFEILVRGI